jgi:hypothetical protein
LVCVRKEPGSTLVCDRHKQQQQVMITCEMQFWICFGWK